MARFKLILFQGIFEILLKEYKYAIEKAKAHKIQNFINFYINQSFFFFSPIILKTNKQKKNNTQ